jgi:YfiH family protein
MTRTPAWSGVAFSDGTDGDLRNDIGARSLFSARLGLPSRWATVHQVHGSRVLQVSRPGEAGDADGLWTTTSGLPVAVFTADCFGVVLHAESAVGVAHAGWRGVRAGVVSNVIAAMTASGHYPQRAAMGPGIRPCCFEVGPEVAGEFGGFVTETSWGTTSVDLAAALRAQLGDIEQWDAAVCTLHEDGSFSHRRDQTPARMAAVGWLL